MLRQNFSEMLWISVLCLFPAIYFLSMYAPVRAEQESFVYSLIFYISALTLGLTYLLLIGIIIVFPIQLLFSKLKLKRVKSLCSFFIWFVALFLLATDAHVYSLYRFHINFAILDLTFNSKGQVISFNSSTTFAIFIEILVMAIYVIAALCAARKLVTRGIKINWFLYISLFLFITINLGYALGSAKGVTSITDLSTRLPLFRPLTMNSFLIKHGFIKKEDLSFKKINLFKGSSSFNYPKHELFSQDNFFPNNNVLIIGVDSLRSDSLNAKLMPKTYEFAKNAYVFKNCYSSGNSTRSGIFGLFYGIPSGYWQFAKNSHIPAAIVSVAQQAHYDVKVFASAVLYKPEFNETVFSGVNNLRIESKGGDAVARDKNCIDDFKSYIESKGDKKFFSFIFLDNVHALTVPGGYSSNHLEPNYLNLNSKKEGSALLRQYQNAVSYADLNIERIINVLKASDRLKDTVIIITSDHGSEFNDNGLGYWGHNSNFSDAQIKIPLVVYWPQRGKGFVEELSLNYDVPVTLMQDVFGIANPVDDYAVGLNLFSLKPRTFFISGSYLENAVRTQKEIMVIDSYGKLKIKNFLYKDQENKDYDAESLKQALYQLSEFIK